MVMPHILKRQQKGVSMIYVFLPHENNMWLHQLEGNKPIPVAKLPGSDDARYFMSTDHTLFAFLDQAQKRIGLYQLLDAEPWFEKKMSPVTLPKNCLGDDVLIHNAIIYIGGRSKSGEFLWQRTITDQNWLALPFPDDFSPKRYKSIDLLFLDGNKLIAVDDIVYPKWIFTYDISEPKHPKPIGMATLKQHTSYESVYGGADNNDYIVLLSEGINHDQCFKFISLLDKKTLEEFWFWSTKKPKEYDSLLPFLPSDIVDPEQIEDIIGMMNEIVINATNMDEKLAEIRAQSTVSTRSKYIESNAVYNVAFLANYLMLATEDGLMAVDTTMNDDVLADDKWVFKSLTLKNLLSPYYFVKIPKSDSELFVVGLTADEKIAYELITFQDLRQVL